MNKEVKKSQERKTLTPENNDRQGRNNIRQQHFLVMLALDLKADQTPEETDNGDRVHRTHMCQAPV